MRMQWPGRTAQFCRWAGIVAPVILFISALALTVQAKSWFRPAFFLAVSALVTTLVCAWLQARQSQRFLLRIGRMALGDGAEDDESPCDNMSAVSLLELLDHRLEASTTASALKTEAELHALQNQINPHFLYNTLEIIRSRALVQGNQDVAEMVESLALQFRYCINSQGEMVTLRQELDHVHNYLLIQSYRFGERIRYKELIGDQDEGVMNCKLPVLTLQPIIENALLHGITPRVEGGCIKLRLRASATRLYVVVEDDGVGIPEDALKRMRQTLQEDGGPTGQVQKGHHSSGIAMRNVNQRIHLHFGENYGVDVTSTVGMGTSVFITLPLIHES